MSNMVLGMCKAWGTEHVGYCPFDPGWIRYSLLQVLSPNDGMHSFVVPAPVATAYTPLGHATHELRAWDVE